MHRKLVSLNLLGKQLSFHSARRYRLVNRLFETFRIACFVVPIDDGYVEFVLQSTGKVLGVTMTANSTHVDAQESSDDVAQQWDIVATGEEDFYRVKTRSRAMGQIDFLLLEVTGTDFMQINVAQRDDTHLGQQWRILP